VNTHTYTVLDDPNAAKITRINNNGEITGFFVDAAGVQRGFFAVLVTPEPSTLALFGLGLAARRRWRR
jgi:hypothetical protein